jgi:predicted methyltransferase
MNSQTRSILPLYLTVAVALTGCGAGDESPTAADAEHAATPSIQQAPAAEPEPAPAVDERSPMERALAAPDRPAVDRRLDDARKPVELVGFLGIEPGMTVLDAISGDGYYTEVLAAAVGPSGKVISQNPNFILDICSGDERTLSDRLAGARLPNVERRDVSLEKVGPDNEVDVAFLALTLHGFNNMEGETGVLRNLEALRRVLKPGGVLGVIDHVGVEGSEYKPLYRIDPAVAVRYIETAGFDIEARSDLLANPADDHTAIVFDPSVKDNTDRFLIRARKPAG